MLMANNDADASWLTTSFHLAPTAYPHFFVIYRESVVSNETVINFTLVFTFPRSSIFL